MLCPPLPPDLNCSESGITTDVPTLSPTLAPTFTSTNNIGIVYVFVNIFPTKTRF